MINIKLYKKISLITITELWLNNKNNLKIQSRQKYENLINIYLKDTFNIPTNKLSLNNFEQFFNSINKKNVSISIQKTLLYIIKSSLNYGSKNKLCNFIELNNIKFKKVTPKIYTLSLIEQKKLEKELLTKPNIRKCCLLLCLYTGLRVGEVCGLKWEDINFDAKTIEIKRTIQRINCQNESTKTKLIISTPKSDTSNRIIPIPNFLLNILKQFKNEEKYFLLSNTPKLYDPRLLESFYTRTLTKCLITPNKFHTLRHTFATRAIESKMDVKTLSEILGHSSIDITLKLYVHPSQELKKNSIENLVEFISKA